MRVANPKNVTIQDIRDLKRIALCGFVRIDLDSSGYGYLESGRRITPGRLERLRQLGFICPNMDSMFGVSSQTWRITDGTDVEKIKKGPAKSYLSTDSNPRCQTV